MKKWLLGIALGVGAVGAAWAAGETVASFGIATGTNPRNVCVFDLSVSRPCVPIGSLDSTLHTFTPVSATITPSVPGGRLTLTSGAPIMVTDVPAATTVYYTPYYGSGITIWNGTALISYNFAEISQALDASPGHTGYQAINNTFDEFIIADGTTLRLCTGPAWANSLSRGTGAGTTELEYNQGFLSNKVTINCRWGNNSGNLVSVPPHQGTFIGSIRTTADGTTAFVTSPAAASGGNIAYIAIWNNYNQVGTQAINDDNGAQYDYSSATWRPARNSANNSIFFLQGNYGSNEIGYYWDRAITDNSINDLCAIGIGLDATSTPYKGVSSIVSTNSAANQTGRPSVTLLLPPLLGWHVAYALESSGSTPCVYNGGTGLDGIIELQVSM